MNKFLQKFGASLAALTLVSASLATPAFATPLPHANGGIGYNAYGLQRYADFDVHQGASNTCSNTWNVTGNYNVTFMLTNDNTPYTHSASFTQTGTSVTGNGGYPATGPQTYTWHVTSGTVTGNSINLTIVYDTGALGTTMHMTGTIANDGTMSGTWDDNFGGARTGTWSTTSGHATLMSTSCSGNGYFHYADINGDWYAVNLDCAFISGNTAVFSGKVFAASQPAWTNNWLIAKVVDNGQPGINHDTVSGSFVGSNPMCNASLIVDGPFIINGGNIVVH